MKVYNRHQLDAANWWRLNEFDRACNFARWLEDTNHRGRSSSIQAVDHGAGETGGKLLLHVTARGRDEDCVSRSFAPKLSVAEDPVCGSGHCHIIPYWADRLGKDELVARRGGTLYCRREGSKIFMAGKAALYSIDELYI